MKFAGIVELFLLESRPEREKETSAFPLQELTLGGIAEAFIQLN